MDPEADADGSPDLPLDAHLRAGVAVYNDGWHHAAHDAWEPTWLALPEGEDKRLLQGLIQVTAAVHHATEGNAEGAAGLADSARGYLADLPEGYRGVDLAGARAACSTLAADPTLAAHDPPTLRYEGRRLGLADLDLRATLAAAPVVAEAAGLAVDPVERAVKYARADRAEDDRPAGGASGDDPFVGLLFDLVREPEGRALVHDRLADHVARRRRREADVAGLFD